MTEKRKRNRRSHTEYLNCREETNETDCCRFPLTIDFDEFGWDWILQPRQYKAFYCAGRCSYAFIPNSQHSQIVMLGKDASRTGGPCCTPVEMQEMSMIYYDAVGTIKSRVLDDMVVDRCGCN